MLLVRYNLLYSQNIPTPINQQHWKMVGNKDTFDVAKKIVFYSASICSNFQELCSKVFNIGFVLVFILSVVAARGYYSQANQVTA